MWTRKQYFFEASVMVGGGFYSNKKLDYFSIKMWLGLWLFFCFCGMPRAMAWETAITVTNIAELRSLDISTLESEGYSNITAYVRGYYAPDDRGGGMFLWRGDLTSADDGGRWIAANSQPTMGRWQRLLNGNQANVRMWGAHGDGANDDTVAITNAVYALWSGYEWCEDLLFPSGEYIVTNTIVFPNQIHIHGEGQLNNTEVMMPAGINKDIFCTYGAYLYLTGNTNFDANADYDHGLVFENMLVWFLGDEGSRNTSNACLVVCQPGEGSEIRNLILWNGGYGIRCIGGGAPGLRAHDVTTGGAAIAGVDLEPIIDANGNEVSTGGSVNLLGISGDYRWQSYSSTACLIRFYHQTCVATVQNFKAEGLWGGGIVRYSLPYNCANPNNLGSLIVQGGTYDCGPESPQTNVPCDVIVLDGTNQTPAVSVQSLNVYGVRYLINDEVTGRLIDPNTEVYSGLEQNAATLPICYQATSTSILGDPFQFSRLTKGQTAFSYLYATNSGWYRILDTRYDHLSGKLVISCPVKRQSAELEFDVANEAPSTSTLLSVNRAPAYGGVSAPVITQARAYWYTASNGINHAVVDVLVGNPLNQSTPQENRVAFAMELDDMEDFGTGFIDLCGVPFSVSLPSTNYCIAYVNTYR